MTPRRAAALSALFACALAATLAWTMLCPPGANDLIGGDEGYYGTMARNVLATPAQVVSPSLTPLGPPGDKPPLYPLMIAASLRAFGLTRVAVRFPSLACEAAIPFATGALLLPAAGVAGALFATVLLATLPWFADTARAAAAELPLTALALAALLALAAAPRSRARAALAGALLGLAFLCKLWLVAPAALACAALVGVRDRAARSAFLVLVACALAVASAHLVAVACLRPPDLAHWAGIYLGRSLAERVRGEGYADYWRPPAGLYWATVTRAFGLVLPWIAAGIEDAWRRRAEPLPRALLAWAAGLLLLSAFAVKSGGYALVVVPAWCALAALGLRGAHAGRLPHAATWVIGALLTSPLVGRWHANGLPFAAWLAVWIGAIAMLVTDRRWPVLARRLVVGWAIAAIVAGSARTVQRLSTPFHAPGLAAAAALAAPRLADVPPQRTCYVAPEAPVFAFHLFRTGAYWATPNHPWTTARLDGVRADTALRVFVIDTGRTLYGGWPDSAALAWLERDTREITASLPADARGGPLRVFVR